MSATSPAGVVTGEQDLGARSQRSVGEPGPGTGDPMFDLLGDAHMRRALGGES
jgi:hypothetical protein